MRDKGSCLQSIVCVAETPWKSVGPEFEHSHGSIFSCHLFLQAVKSEQQLSHVYTSLWTTKNPLSWENKKAEVTQLHGQFFWV